MPEAVLRFVIAATVASSCLLASAPIHADDPPGCLDTVFSWPGGRLSDVASLVPGRVLAVAQDATLLVLDISGSYAFEVARLPLGSTINDMVVCDDRLLVADDHGLAIVDVTDPAAPFELSGLATPNRARAVACSGRRALVAVKSDGVHLVDVHDAADPTWLDFRPLSVVFVAMLGPIALATHGGGVDSYDVSGNTLEVVRTLLMHGYPSRVEIWAGRAFVISENRLVSWELDLSDPRAETEVTPIFNLHDVWWHLALGGGLAFLKGFHCGLTYCTYYGAYVLDLSDPVQPVMIAASAPGTPDLISGDRVIEPWQGLTVRDGAACIADRPEARMLWWPPSPATGEAVHFEDASTLLPSSWSWSFGDGSTSERQNPTHTYSHAGLYDVVLTVSNHVGADTGSQTVSVRDGFRRPRGRLGP